MLLLAILLLLALVAVASGARGRGAIEPAPRGVPMALFDYLYTLGVLLLVVLFLSALLVRPRGAPPSRDPTGFLRLAVFMALITLFAYAAMRGGLGQNGIARLQELLEGRESGDGAAGAPDPGGGEVARFRWELAAALAALAACLGLAYAVRRTRRRERPEGQAVAEELAALLDDTLDDLRAEQDSRRAVIASYARMERALAAHGSPRRPSEAPLEYLARILRDLRVSAAAALDLTALFERAKFSPHAVDAGMKDEAIAALVAVRDDLRAAA